MAGQDSEKKAEPEDPQGRIKVTDRRAFTATGERRTAEPDRPEQGPAATPDEPIKGEGFEMRASAGARRETERVVAMGFGPFISSLATTAFIHLGEIEDPVTKKRHTDTAAAREIIDIIDMLRAKTKGNLDQEEVQLIEGVLCELKIQYARRASSS